MRRSTERVSRRAGPPRILALWSAPRCRSTAFFRMMAQRGDFHVLHEPFSYLMEFGATTVDGATVRSERELAGAIRELSTRAPVFFKDTTDSRYPGLLADTAFLRDDATHAFMIRHPRETIRSYYALNPAVRNDQIGFAHLYEIFAAVADLVGDYPVVLDAQDLVRDPERAVEAFCARVSIPYQPEALSWEPGARDEWLPSARWHVDASQSRGFAALANGYDADADAVPTLMAYLRHHLPYYERLRAHKMRV
ncbi:MAG: sulfotransferase family protein [Egibacteraceae bacterium]